MSTLEIIRNKVGSSEEVPITNPNVEAGDWASSSGRLATVSASTCIILAAHNTQTATGLLGHFSAPTNKGFRYNRLQGQSYRVALKNIERLGDAEHTHVWLGGDALGHIDEADDEERLADREFSEEEIRQLFGSTLGSLAVEWGDERAVTAAQLDNPLSRLTVVSFIKPPSDQY